MMTIVILGYHGVVADTSESNNKYNITIAEFKWHMKMLSEHQFRSITTRDLADASNPDSPDARLVMITFDDGHRSNFTDVPAILRDHSFKGVFFLTTAQIQTDPACMSWEQAVQLHQDGHTVEAHGHTHRFFNQLNAIELVEELANSRHLIYQHTGAYPTAVSCPGGRTSDQLIKSANQLGYHFVFSSKPGYYYPKLHKTGNFLNRWIITRGLNEGTFERILRQDKTLLLRARCLLAVKKIIRSATGESGYQKLADLIYK